MSPISINFNPHPGAFERHIIRKHNNALFPNSTIDANERLEAQCKDSDEIKQFNESLQSVIQNCLSLDKSAETDDILKLKEQLDKLYEQSCGLAGEHTDKQQAIISVITPMMTSIEKAASDDPKAIEKLVDEKTARVMHFEMLKTAIVADLLRPDSPIQEDELTAALLSEEQPAFEIVMQLFSDEQKQTIYQDAKQLIETLDIDKNHPAHLNLAILLHSIQTNAAL